MEAMPLAPPATLMDALKSATHAAHARLEGTPYFQALSAGQLPLESYVGQLRALLAMHGVIEPCLAGSADPRIAAVWQADMAKCPLLEQDLQYFEPRTVADLRPAVERAQTIADHLRLLAASTPWALLGALYVLEGSMLGAMVVQPLVARALSLVGVEGTAYLHGYGADTRACWQDFARRMNALDLTADERAQILLAATDLFSSLEALFLALYPFAPEAKTLRVSSINPEAGRHPVPADLREMEAAVRAGDLCWACFPYYAARYGERGLRFARSDAAWLATLHVYPPAQILQQVRWLGRLLAVRGMPSCLLQIQLEILVDELTVARPENGAAYAKLLPAAADLRERRLQVLSDEEAGQLAAAFDAAVGAPWNQRLPDTGRLLCAAVADETKVGDQPGNDRAVSSLCDWLADEQHFPAAWCAAVQRTVDEARRLARLKRADAPIGPATEAGGDSDD